MAKKPAQIFHFDLYGKREDKYDFLDKNSISSIKWTELKPEEPNFFFVNKNFDGQGEYEKGVKVDVLFISFGMGITTGNDKDLIDFQKEVLVNKFPDNNVMKVYYRLFDIRYINYDMKLVERAREKLMTNFIENDNYGLISLKGVRNQTISKFGISNIIIDKSVISTIDNGYIFPLYLYSENFGKEERAPNFNMKIVNQIEKSLGLKFVSEKDTSTGSVSDSTFAPIDILDYIYAVLHSPTYREKYKEFLKIDFPRVPYPTNKTTFWKLVKLGSELRQIHLLESPIVERYITQYPESGNNLVTKPLYKNGNVYINDTQYFANVPQTAWEFYIGGYQPAQKWLKDRKNRILEYDDILHYQKIIVALTETHRLMNEINKIGIE